MKVVIWWGSSLDDVRTFADLARQRYRELIQGRKHGRKAEDDPK